MPTASSTTDFSKVSGLKHGNEPHEAIARRTRIDRVRFYDRRAALSCELHGSGEDALAHALAAQASNDKKRVDGRLNAAPRNTTPPAPCSNNLTVPPSYPL